MSALLLSQRDQPIRACFLCAIRPYLAFDFITTVNAALQLVIKNIAWDGRVNQKLDYKNYKSARLALLRFPFFRIVHRVVMLEPGCFMKFTLVVTTCYQNQTFLIFF